jgi:serine protease
MTRLRRPHAVLLMLAGALALCSPPLHAHSASDDAQARGLIVRLKDAPAHEILSPRTANARQRETASALAANESTRWQRVLGEAGLSGASGRREPRLRPVGRDQQLLQFERPLSRSEVAQLRDKLLQRADVEWVEANVRERRLQVPPGDPLFAGSSGQWWLQQAGGNNQNRIEARLRGVAGFQRAWLRAGDAPAAVVVAVLDTGITTHPDLAGRVLPGYDFVSEVVFANDGDGRDGNPADPGDWVSSGDLGDPNFAGCAVADSSWHGTVIAGMLAANTNNGLGGAGIHWAASILPVRVAGKCGAVLTDIVDGMRWAAGLQVAGVAPNPNPSRVINISFGGSAACGSAYQTAIDELRARGVVVVAAAGNEWRAPTRPASCRGVIGVAGLNRDGFKANYSNFGAALAASGIATVSGDDADGAWGSVLRDSGLLTLTNPGRTMPEAIGAFNGYEFLYGTSFAAPQVAGAIALMLSLNPQLSFDQIQEGLRLSARPHVSSAKIALCSDANPGRCICTTETCGVGILDAERALIYARGLVLPPIQAALIDTADVDAALALAPQDRPSNMTPLPPAQGGGGDGGGAFGAFWLLALATAAMTLRALAPVPRRR